MPDVTNHLARALIEAHGADALDYARRAAANVRGLGMQKKAEEWDRVIEAIKVLTGGTSDA